MYQGLSPLPDGILSYIQLMTSGEVPIHLSVTVKGQNMAYRQKHIGKTTYLWGKLYNLSNSKT